MKVPKTTVAVVLAAAGAVVVGRRIAIREDLDWRSVDKPGEIIDVDGYGVHYVDVGHGPAIVLLHGFGGSTYSYRYLIPAFSQDHRVIAVDLKGFGYSERNAGAGLSAEDQVTMLRALLERCAVSSAVFVGHSMGGGIAQRFAARYPETVSALVLAASVTGEERAARARMGAVPARLLRPALPVLAGIAASRLLKLLYVDQSKVTPDVREEYVRPARIRGSMDGLLAMMRDRAKDGPIDDTRVTMPVMLLCGAQDEVVPLRAAQRLRERIPHARLVVIERAAHGLLEERPQECARAIRDFLRDAGGGTRGSTAAASSA
jgi:pimeloyl-ACP methyl ester carboxylesterase